MCSLDQVVRVRSLSDVLYPTGGCLRVNHAYIPHVNPMTIVCRLVGVEFEYRLTIGLPWASDGSLQNIDRAHSSIYLCISFTLTTMSADHLNAPPPIYTQQDAQNAPSPTPTDDDIGGPQLLILPAGDTVQFQSGFLGAEGERAAIEGEVQIKGVEGARWDKLSVTITLTAR